MKAVLYMRYSCENQTEQSIEGQRRDCLRYAENNGISIVGEYVDRALSGTNDNRPEFQRMISDSFSHKFDAVIVWKLDRFSRSVSDTANYGAILSKKRVQLISTTENFEDSCEGELMKNIMTSFNAYYSKELSRKIKRGMSVSAEKGHYCGAPLPPGYTYDKSTMEVLVDEGTAPIVKEAFRLFADQEYSISQVEEEFLNRGYKRASGKPFTNVSLYRMLTNRKYLGEYKVGDTIGKIAPIISKEAFEKAQKRIRAKAKRPRVKCIESDYLLTGKLYCSCCGGMMVAEQSQKKNKDGMRTYRYYKCQNTKTYFKKVCDCRAVSKSQLECFVLKASKDWLMDSKLVRDTAHAIFLFQAKKSPLLESMENRLKDINQRLGNICDALERGYTSDTTLERLKALESEKRSLIESIGKESLNYAHADECAIWYALEEFRHNDVGDEPFLRFILANFIDRIEYNQKTGAMSIIYKWKKSEVSVEANLQNSELVRLAKDRLLHL